jgi:hypothetical protein
MHVDFPAAYPQNPAACCACTLVCSLQIEPDVEFGGFLVLYGPAEGEFKDHCLVEVDLGGGGGG